MSIFGNIMSKIFGHAPAHQASNAGAASAPSGSAQPTTAGPSSASSSSVDVEAVLTALAAKKKEKLDWRKSIVDLMKLLDLDSSLPARTELATELHCTEHQLRGLRTARFAIGMRLMMRIVQWLERPAATFIYAAHW